MKFDRLFSLATLAAALATAGSVEAGCSSSSQAPAAAVQDSGGGTSTSDVDAGPPVGAQCASNGDCPSGGECSNAVFTSGNPIYPTPICLGPCTPSASTQGLAACGSTEVPGAGLCQPPSGSGQGLCLPFCEVTPFGTVVGCEANDVCQLLGTDGTDGAGWCQPGCTTNSQCPAGSVCDPLLAACVAHLLVPTAPIGAPCGLTVSPPPCNCVGPPGAPQGYCTAACVTGASACPSPFGDGGAGAAVDGGDEGGTSPAPTAWVCSAGLNLVTDADGGAVFPTQPPGLYGFCTPPCNTDTDCASIGGVCSQGDPAAPSGFTGTCVMND